MRPNQESISHLLGWKDLEGFRTRRADDLHGSDRFGRTVVLCGSYLIVSAGSLHLEEIIRISPSTLL
jgi:hypothetical protein